MTPKRRLNTIRAKEIALMGLLIGIEVIFTRFFSIQNSFVRISVGFLPLMMMGHLFKPWLAGVGGILGDLVGMLILPKAMFFPGFTFNAWLIPFIYGVFFYRKEITLKRNIMSQLVIMGVISLILTPVWLNLLFKIPMLELLPVRMVQQVITVPFNILLSHYLFNKTSLGKIINLNNEKNS